jgi:hypothetical protein
MKKHKKKQQETNTLPADSAARLPDTQMPRSLMQPKSENAITQQKHWGEQNEK